MNRSEQPHSGESGHKGRDRQPEKNPGSSTGAAPDQQQAATPAQVQSRSRAAQHKPVGKHPDPVHPGPDRNEAEKSKGHLHHDQREPQPDMQNEVEEL
jgi:hypothetical protein